MRRIATFCVLLGLFLGAAPTQAAERINMTSSAFANGADIPVKYTCDGADVSPPLRWGKLPRRTAELVLIVDDPDAPNGTYTHWVVYNISPKVKQIAEGSVPLGSRQGTNDFGSQGWGGPCPPAFQTHRYFFTLYALGKPLGLPAGHPHEHVRSMMAGKIRGSGQLMGRYCRRLVPGTDLQSPIC